MRKILVLVSVLLVSTAVLSCGKSREAADADARGKVLATVNGIPIFEKDMVQGARNQDSGQDMLKDLVRQELIHQKALKLGLDKDNEYRRRIGDAEAQLQRLKKQELSRLLRERITSQAAVTEPEIRDYFEKNSSLIKTKYHVQMIFYRGNDAQLAEDLKAIQGGTPFEEVASRRFPGIPKGMKAPWDLGVLGWDRLPDLWRDALERLEPGQVSPIIPMPGGHRGVIRMVGKTVDPDVSYTMERERIVTFLRNRKIEEIQDRMVKEMENESKIVYAK